MRTDVWALIRRYDESLDKAVQYVNEIVWSQNDFLRLLSYRIKANIAIHDIHKNVYYSAINDFTIQEKILTEVFAEKMKWGEKEVSTYKILYTLSYERPRWAIQLCKLAQESAIKKHYSRIDKDNIDEVWGEYGSRRIADLVAEHKHQCPQIEELLNAFRGANRMMSRDELFRWINNRITNHVSPKIENVVTNTPMEIARFLYRIGFILARSEKSDEYYVHYRFDQKSDFLSSRTDDDFGLKWEVHPCYREALDIKKIDRYQREKIMSLRRKDNRG